MDRVQESMCTRAWLTHCWVISSATVASEIQLCDEFRLDLGPLRAIRVSNPAEPAADPETLLTGRVLDDPVERHILADDDRSHVASPSVGLCATEIRVGAAPAVKRRTTAGDPQS
jgi:hypothetical protein